MAYRKYKNRKVDLDGFTFDSMAEAERYAELRLLERAGEITDLEVHPRFIIQPRFVHNGKTYRPVYYEADFSYTDLQKGKQVVEDVKGFDTPVSRLKRKLLLARQGIEVIIIR